MGGGGGGVGGAGDLSLPHVSGKSPFNNDKFIIGKGEKVFIKQTVVELPKFSSNVDQVQR